MSDNEIAEQTAARGAMTEAGAERELTAEEQRQLEEMREKRREALAQVRTFGDPVLKSKASEVTEFGPHLDAEAERMFALMHDALGIGLAATQLGAMRRMLVFQAGPDAEPRARSSTPRSSGSPRSSSPPRRAACRCPGSPSTSSGPCTHASAPRTPPESASCSRHPGLEARVLQHEIDHLDGVLILDRTERDQRRAAMRALRNGESFSPEILEEGDAGRRAPPEGSSTGSST